jgi:uncharacterized protein DUF4189
MSRAHRAALVVLGLSFLAPAHAAKVPPKKPWGAIAYSSATGAFGYAVDQASKRSAETEAFRQCGGDCDVIRSFRNGCGAIAEAQKHYAWDTGASREIAEIKARKKCGAESCRITVWACTGGK